MRRLFLKGHISEKMEITGSDAHHLMHVLRSKVGDRVVVADDDGIVCEAKMAAFSEDAVTLHLVRIIDADTESPVSITLVQCLLKGAKMDFVVQKAVELGVDAIHPVMSSNCVVKYDKQKQEKRRQKWQAISDEAAKQCARTRLPVIQPICTLEEDVSKLKKNGTEILFCYENEEKTSSREALSAMNGSDYAVIIGPEGGFTLDEASMLRDIGAVPVTLGPRILRAETAALAALTVLQHDKGDL